MEFQENTSASVAIVVMKENKNMLYNGLTHVGFVRRLQNDVSDWKLHPPVPVGEGGEEEVSESVSDINRNCEPQEVELPQSPVRSISSVSSRDGNCNTGSSETGEDNHTSCNTGFFSSNHKEIRSNIGRLVDDRDVGVKNTTKGSKNEGFKIMHPNVQDLKSRFDLLQIALSEIKLDILALSEHNMANSNWNA